MKKITCEICGSTDLLKQNGVFMCQDCGTKYSVEEAKNLMKDYPDPDAFVVPTDEIKVQEAEQTVYAYDEYKDLANARSARKNQDWDDVLKYYNKVKECDPENMEAIFYCSYAKARKSLVDSDFYKREAIFNSLIKTVSVINEYFRMENEEEYKKIIYQICDDIIAIGQSSFVYRKIDNGDTGTAKLFFKLCYATIDSLSNVINKYDDDKKSLYLRELIIKEIDLEENLLKAHFQGEESKFLIDDLYYNLEKVKKIQISAIEKIDPQNQFIIKVKSNDEKIMRAKEAEREYMNRSYDSKREELKKMKKAMAISICVFSVLALIMLIIMFTVSFLAGILIFFFVALVGLVVIVKESVAIDKLKKELDDLFTRL